jgi:hypothetical protein
MGQGGEVRGHQGGLIAIHVHTILRLPPFGAPPPRLTKPRLLIAAVLLVGTMVLRVGFS